MLDNISILITGNPISSSGFTNIGHVGSGLSAYDPEWPALAKGQFVLLISENEMNSRYILVFSSSMISSAGSNRSGLLNFQLLLPFNQAIVDGEGKLVSPFGFLIKLFEKYKALHLKSYPGVEGWNFSENAKMTDEEFKDFLKDYALEKYVLPQRRLAGEGDATIVQPVDKIEQLAFDHAYKELTAFKRLILCTDGITNPPLLAGLEIPRRPVFDVYVNGLKQNCTIREGDAPFLYTVMPLSKYQQAETINVSFDKDEHKVVDHENERIDYTLRFKDTTEERTVTIQLSGCEGEQELYSSIIKELLDSTILKSTTVGIDCLKGEKYPKSKSVLFTLKGTQIGYDWAPQCISMPKGVKPDGIIPISVNWIVRFRYEKPVEIKKLEPGNVGDKNNGDKERKTVAGKIIGKKVDVPTPASQPIAEIPVYITAKDSNDHKLIEQCRNLCFDLELNGKSTDPSLTYRNLTSTGSAEQKKLSRHDVSERECFASKIKIPTVCLHYLEKAKDGIDAVCDDDHFMLKARFLSISGEPVEKGFIRIYVKRRKPLPYCLKSPWIVRTIFALLMFCLGWWIGESYSPWTNMFTSEKVQRALEHPEDSVNGVDLGNGAGGVVESEKSDTTQSDDSVIAESQQDHGADTPDYTALQNNADAYKSLIKEGSISFAQVDEIDSWVNRYDAVSEPIDGFNEIKRAINSLKQCRGVILKIKMDADYESLTPKIKGVVFSMPTGSLLLELRKKMQKFTHGANNQRLSDDEIAGKLVDYATSHPNGITSFAEL